MQNDTRIAVDLAKSVFEVAVAAWSLVEDAGSELPDALRPAFAEAC
jgi:hypothetical protein